MSKNRDPESIIDIYQAAKRISDFSQGINRDDLETDEMRLSAILYQIAVMGEATKRLSSEFRQQHSSIPWKEMAGIRDKLIHKYDNVKLDVVWNVIKKEIPVLQEQLEPLLSEK